MPHHRQPQLWRERRQPRLQFSKLSGTRQRMGLQHAFGQLVDRCIRVVAQQQLVQIVRQPRLAAVADLDFDAIDQKRHHTGAVAQMPDRPSPFAADGSTGLAQTLLVGQRSEDHAHVDVGPLVDQVVHGGAGDKGQQRRVVNAAMGMGHALRDFHPLASPGLQRCLHVSVFLKARSACLGPHQSAGTPLPGPCCSSLRMHCSNHFCAAWCLTPRSVRSFTNAKACRRAQTSAGRSRVR